MTFDHTPFGPQPQPPPFATDPGESQGLADLRKSDDAADYLVDEHLSPQPHPFRPGLGVTGKFQPPTDETPDDDEVEQ